MKLANICTYMSVAAGMLAILFGLQSRYALAGGMLLASVILDFLDGRIARLMNQREKFGMYLDSLADIVAFGVAPAVLLLLYVIWTPAIVVALVYVTAGVFRLARFQEGNGKVYKGMPITVNGVVLGIMYVFGVMPLVIVIYMLLASILMILRFEVKKPW